MNRYKMPALVALTLTLSGCVLPESFESSIIIHKDGTLTETFKGTTLLGATVAAMAKNGGTLSDKDKAAFEKMTRDYAKRNQIEGKFRQDGRSYFEFNQRKVSAKQGALFSILSVESVGNRHSITSNVKITPKETQMLKKANYRLSGQLTVHSHCQVIESNAQTINQDKYYWSFNDPNKTQLIMTVECNNP